jgi:hypothetical protein
MRVYHLNSSVTLNAAAPKRDAPAAVLGTVNAKNLLAPPCLGEALRRGALPNMNFNSWLGKELPSCAFLQSPKKSIFNRFRVLKQDREVLLPVLLP